MFPRKFFIALIVLKMLQNSYIVLSSVMNNIGLVVRLDLQTLETILGHLHIQTKAIVSTFIFI
jgi:hypothetical protein